MLVKTFQASDMAAALRMVKAELGADALIISSKMERRKGIMGIFSRPFAEVTAAFDPRPVPALPARVRLEEQSLSTREEFQNSMLGPIARELKELRQRVEKLSQRESNIQPLSMPEERLTEKTVPFLPIAESPRIDTEKEEFKEFKRLLTDAIEAKQKELATHLPVTSESGEGNIDTELPAEPLARKSFGKEIAAELGDVGLTDEAVGILMKCLGPAIETGGREELGTALTEILAGMVRCTGPLLPKGERPRIVAFIGPAGVGKTTTALKMAATHARKKGAVVALISSDNRGALERVGDVSRLQGISLETAKSPEELGLAISAHSDKSLILIDTAGICHKDGGKLGELKCLLDSGFAIESQLCLSATTRDRELREIINNFGILPISGLLFTRLDECETFSSIVNAHLWSRLPLTYFSKGQRVPDDLEVARGRKLAKLLLGSRCTPYLSA